MEKAVTTLYAEDRLSPRHDGPQMGKDGKWQANLYDPDGTRVELGPGELSLGEDQGCTPDAQGRRGHRAGTVGDQPAVLMTVQLHVAPVRRACSRK